MEDERVAFLNPGLPKRIQAPSQQLSCEPTSTIRLGDRKATDVSATPVVSAKTISNEPAFLKCDKAASGIRAQKPLEVLRLVR